jgi:hypothetical protein
MILAAALAALAAGLARGAAIDAVSDECYHLLRAGTPLLHGSIAGFTEPPGGENAPILGAAVAAFADQKFSKASHGRSAAGIAAIAGSSVLLALAVAPRSLGLACFGAGRILLPPAFGYG